MRLFTLLAFVLLTTALSAQNRTIRKFIQHHNNGLENVSVTIPGFLIGLAGEIGLIASDCDEDRAAFHLVQALGTTKVLTFHASEFNTDKNVRRLFSELETEHGFERWATVRAATGERVDLSVQTHGKVVSRVVAFINSPDDDQAVFLDARTDFTAEELGRILNELEL